MENHGEFIGRIAALKKRKSDVLLVLAVNSGWKETNFLPFFSEEQTIMEDYEVGDTVSISAYVRTGVIFHPRRKGEERFYYQKLMISDLRRCERLLSKKFDVKEAGTAYEEDRNELYLSGVVSFIRKGKNGDFLRLEIPNGEEIQDKGKFQAPGVYVYGKMRETLKEIREGDRVCLVTEVRSYWNEKEHVKITKIVCRDLAIDK